MTRDYDKAIGYSPLECVDAQKMGRLIEICKKIISDYYLTKPSDTVLVAGAGSGQEAILIKKEFQLRTIGIDININPHRLNYHEQGLEFLIQDLTNLAFRENVFPIVYCYHVLEHVMDHMLVLGELHRVLKPGGVLFIGFPNKHRLISYIGTSQKASAFEKIKWNMLDYSQRLKGKFENKYGAHAGFTEKEFMVDASNIFTAVQSVRNQYLLMKYPGFRGLLG